VQASPYRVGIDDSKNRLLRTGVSTGHELIITADAASVVNTAHEARDKNLMFFCDRLKSRY